MKTGVDQFFGFWKARIKNDNLVNLAVNTHSYSSYEMCSLFYKYERTRVMTYLNK